MLEQSFRTGVPKSVSHSYIISSSKGIEAWYCASSHQVRSPLRDMPALHMSHSCAPILYSRLVLKLVSSSPDRPVIYLEISSGISGSVSPGERRLSGDFELSI